MIWQCGTCIKVKNTLTRQNPPLIAVKKATPRQVPAPQKAVIIDIDDDDEIIALDEPPKVNETINPGVSRLSNAIVSQRSSTTQDVLSHSSSNAASYNHVLSPPGRTSGTKDKQIRIIDDPFLVPGPTPRAKERPQASSSTKPQVTSESIDLIFSDDEGDDSDDVLEYVTPAPTSKQVVQVDHVEEVRPDPLPRDVPPTAQMSTMITTTQLPNHLLTRWLNDRCTAAGVKLDIRARACLRRDQDAANESAQPPSISPPSRRKFKAHNLNERSFTHLRATLFLSAEGWLREKQTTLPIGLI